MARNYIRKGLRAPKGSVGHRTSLSLSPELWRAVEAHAKRDGLTPAEWCRRAIAGASRGEQR